MKLVFFKINSLLHRGKKRKQSFQLEVDKHRKLKVCKVAGGRNHPRCPAVIHQRTIRKSFFLMPGVSVLTRQHKFCITTFPSQTNYFCAARGSSRGFESNEAGQRQVCFFHLCLKPPGGHLTLQFSSGLLKIPNNVQDSVPFMVFCESLAIGNL